MNFTLMGNKSNLRKNQGFFFSAISILSNFCLEILAILKPMLLKSQLLSDENKTAI